MTPADSVSSPGVALVTGASAGIGAEMVRILAQRGWSLVITARRLDRLEELAREVDPDGTRVRCIPADLSAPGGVDTLLAQIAPQASSAEQADPTGASARALPPTPAVDLLVNNAGFGQWGSYAELDGEREAQMIELNVTALTRLTRVLLGPMLERGRGRILNVASVAGFFPGPFMTSYYATKAYVLSYSEALAAELSGTGVTVTCLCPGATVTEFQDTAGLELPRGVSAGVLSAEEVARQGLDGALSGKEIVVPGIFNRVAVNLPRFLPRRWVTRMLKRVQGARRSNRGT